MKKILLLIIFLLFNSIIFSQNLLIGGLFDPNIQIRYETITIISNQRLEEYVPYIEEAMFDQLEPFMIYKYLKALQTLNSPNLVSFTNQFISLSDEFKNMRPTEDPLEMKVKATLILFNAGDYTTVDYVFELANRDRPNMNAIVLTAIGRILFEVPSYSEEAKTELLYVLNNSTDETSKSLAMMYLSKYSEEEFLTNYLDKFRNDPDETVRDQALIYLFNLEYKGLHSLLLQRLSEDPSEVMRAQITDSILVVYGEPIDLKSVIDYQSIEPDEDIKIWMQFAINDFIPPKLDTLSYYDLCTKLISYTDEMFQYGWIQNEETKDYYIQKLNAVNEAIENKKATAEACSIINEQILPQVELDLEAKLITEEGYKFLHHYTIYIKEEIEEEFGHCP